MEKPVSKFAFQVHNLRRYAAVSEVPSYRKTIICGFKGLNYLDDMPVFPKDRRLAQAWWGSSCRIKLTHTP